MQFKILSTLTVLLAGAQAAAVAPVAERQLPVPTDFLGNLNSLTGLFTQLQNAIQGAIANPTGGVGGITTVITQIQNTASGLTAPAAAALPANVQTQICQAAAQADAAKDSALGNISSVYSAIAAVPALGPLAAGLVAFALGLLDSSLESTLTSLTRLPACAAGN